MTLTSDDEKQKVADALFADGRVINTLSNLRKGNSSPKYDGESILKRAADTVDRRARRYGSSVAALAEKKN